MTEEQIEVLEEVKEDCKFLEEHAEALFNTEFPSAGEVNDLLDHEIRDKLKNVGIKNNLWWNLEDVPCDFDPDYDEWNEEEKELKRDEAFYFVLGCIDEIKEFLDSLEEE